MRPRPIPRRRRPANSAIPNVPVVGLFGLSAEVKRRVFDPFLTTRRDQSSTGLGLHIVYKIVTNCLGGRINLEPRPGAGTKIHIVIPREVLLELAAE